MEMVSGDVMDDGNDLGMEEEAVNVNFEFIEDPDIFKQCFDLLRIFLENKMTKTAFNEILNNIHTFSNPKIPKNLNSLLSFLGKDFSPIKFVKYIYCNNCKEHSITEDSNSLACPKCNHHSISKFYTFDLFEQINDISKRNNFVNIHLNQSKIYQNILENEKNKFLTFTINTHGAKLFESSTRSLHPIFLVINEIKAEERFKICNVILAGLWIGINPNYENYLKPIVKSLITLERGEFMTLNSVNTLVKFFLIFGIFDKPARAAVLNMKMCTGFYGCLKCYQKGSTFKTDKNGSVHIYEYNNYNPSGPKRTDISYKKD